MTADTFGGYWRGRGALWKVYWVYGVAGSVVLAGAIAAVIWRQGFASGWLQPLFALALAYTVWILVSVWRCAFNAEQEFYGHLARSLTVAWAINALLLIVFLEFKYLDVVG